MANKGPILILEDDQEDREIFETAFHKLQIPNRREYFENGRKFLDFLRETQEQPFVILSDIRVGVMNGLELRDEIQKDDYLKKKGIPFVFLTTDYRKKVVEQAYDLTVQGFFVKAYTLEQVEDQLKLIVQYWSNCKHPNSA